MKNIFGQELSEELSKLYEYALSPNGGREEAMLLAEAHGLQHDFDKIVSYDYTAASILCEVGDAFSKHFSTYKMPTFILSPRLKYGLYLLELIPLFKFSDFSRFLPSSIEPNIKYIAGKGARNTVYNWLRGIPKDSLCYQRVIQNLDYSLHEQAINKLKSKCDRVLIRSCGLPPIDWNMVQITILK